MVSGHMGALVFLVAAVVSFTLQGCGETTTPAPSPAPPPPPPPPPPPHRSWTSHPIEVRGNRFYDSVTDEEFRPIGLGMPAVGNDVVEWVRVMRRIKALAPEVNVLRIYELPECSLISLCFMMFMREADKLGIYVLLPGTGTTDGWLPVDRAACTGGTAAGCYSTGNVLAWGEKIVQHFNYPNTLAIVIGNEFDERMLEFISVLKAYARDLKAYMTMCNVNKDSPTRGRMRMIPLMYAISDDQGDAAVRPKADYLFCDGAEVSVDVVGLNSERWCEDEAGRAEYDKISTWVGEQKYPGPFLFSEMGCDRTRLPFPYGGARTWNQVPDFFINFPAVAGFVAYTYHGSKNFEMFDGPTSVANMNQDGSNFVQKLKQVGDANRTSEGNLTLEANRTYQVVVPECPSTILEVPISSYKDVPSYSTSQTGLPVLCPRPWQDPTAEAAATDEVASLSDAVVV